MGLTGGYTKKYQAKIGYLEYKGWMVITLFGGLFRFWDKQNSILAVQLRVAEYSKYWLADNCFILWNSTLTDLQYF